MSQQRRLDNMDDLEEEARKWDKCLTSFAKYLGICTAVGLFASAFIFRRKRWPAIVGVGHGLGMSYANCMRELKDGYVPLPACEPTNK